jgi:hypothetical protein
VDDKKRSDFSGRRWRAPQAPHRRVSTRSSSASGPRARTTMGHMKRDQASGSSTAELASSRGGQQGFWSEHWWTDLSTFRATGVEAATEVAWDAWNRNGLQLTHVSSRRGP